MTGKRCMPGGLALALLISLAPGFAAAAHTGAHAASEEARIPPTARAMPAQWRTYDILVQLQDLPKTYGCDDLWYKFRDVLLKIGARPYLRIEPHRCGPHGSDAGRSPSVQLRFQLPFPLSALQARYADVSAVKRSVRLAPGEPRSLTAGDCALVQQVRDSLFPVLPVRVEAANVSCGSGGARGNAAGGSGAPFAITLSAEVPLPGVRATPSSAR